jgi:hypothetical protein
VVALAATLAMAIDVRLKDGTVISAEKVNVTGSYVMLTLADGRQVAYDVQDVDASSLENHGPVAPAAEPTPAPASLSHGRNLSLERQRNPDDGLTITDKDVAHTRRGAQTAADSTDAAGTATDATDDEGSVQLKSISTRQTEDGGWIAEGEIENTFDQPVQAVQVRVTVLGTEIQVTKLVAQTMGARQTATFSVEISVPEGELTPRLKTVIDYIKREVPTVRRRPGDAPPNDGSMAPLPPRAGADVRPTPLL